MTVESLFNAKPLYSNIITYKDSLKKGNSKFDKRLEQGKDAENYVLAIIKKLLLKNKVFSALSCEDYIEKYNGGKKYGWTNLVDTRKGDIIVFFKKCPSIKAFGINVKRSETNEIATASYYGQETDEFNNYPYNIYLSTVNDYKDTDKWEIILAKLIVNEKPLGYSDKDNTHTHKFYERDQLKKYAIPFNDAFNILLKLKLNDLKGTEQTKNEKNIIKTLLDMIIKRNGPLLSKPTYCNEKLKQDTTIPKITIASNNAYNNTYEQHFFSKREGRYATISEKSIIEANKNLLNNSTNTIFILEYCYKSDKSDIHKPPTKKIYYNKIKDVIDKGLLLFKGNRNQRFIRSVDLEPYMEDV